MAPQPYVPGTPQSSESSPRSQRLSTHQPPLVAATHVLNGGRRTLQSLLWVHTSRTGAGVCGALGNDLQQVALLGVTCCSLQHCVE